MVLFPIDYSDRKVIGKTRESVSAIGLGTWNIRDYNRAEKTFVYALGHYIDNVDTAEMYDNGRAEEFIGRIVRIVGRERVFITTKMHPKHLVSRERVLKTGKQSLRRLGVKEVDLFLIHWPNPSLSIEEQIQNFEVLYEKGLTRYIGVSNFNAVELKTALYSTRQAEIVVDQVHYSILYKYPEKYLLPMAIKEGVTIQAYTPLEYGGVALNPIVVEVAQRINKTPIQVALNYLISRPRVVAIPKTENINHLKEIVGAMGWRLRKDLLEYLEKI